MFDSGFLSKQSHLIVAKTDTQLGDALKSFQGQTQLLLAEETINLSISKHFETMWQFSPKQDVNQEEYRAYLLKYYDKLQDCLKWEGPTESQTELLLAVNWIIESFKVVYLSDSEHKSKDLIQITSRYQANLSTANPEQGFTKLDIGTLMLSPNLSFRPLIDRLRQSPNSTDKLTIDIIQILNERMTFIVETLKCERGVSRSQSEFLNQRRRVNSVLIPRLSELSDPVTRQDCTKILHLLGGQLDQLIEFARGDVLKLINGYLIYIDPFRNDAGQYGALCRYLAQQRDDQSKHMMCSFLSDSNEISEALRSYKESLPQYVYTSLALYSIFTGRLSPKPLGNSKRELSRDIEAIVLQDHINYLSDLNFDFFATEPFFSRIFSLLGGVVSYIPSDISNLKSAIHSSLRRTFSKAFDLGVPAHHITVLVDAATAFLTRYSLKDISEQVQSFVYKHLAQRKQPQEAVEGFFHQLKLKDQADSDPICQGLLAEIYQDEWIITLIDQTFKPTQTVGDEKLLEIIRVKLAEHINLPDPFMNHTLVFLQRYTTLRQHIAKLSSLHSQKKSLPLAEISRANLGQHLAELANSFGHQLVFFRMIYSVLVGYRSYFWGSMSQVDSLLSVLQVAKKSFDLENAFYQQSPTNQLLLSALEKKAVFLLLEMRANCLS